MKPTIEILTKLQENSKKHHDEVFTRLYRYLLRPDIYSISYQHLYSNEGAGTKGVDEDTADGFSEEYVERIIEALRTETYRPKPVRRSYIQKSNGKMRPLGLPTFTDKLVQEVMRMILEAVYEPVFSNYSHGFRPGRSCHTALSQLKHEFIGAGWFVEGDIKGCFDNIDHTVLIAVIGRKIKDARFLKLIRLFLKSGYMEDWKYYGTYSGCPQGGIISPILANIYLNELDSYIEELKKEFDVIPYETKAGKKVRRLTKFNEIDGKKCEDIEPKVITIVAKGRTTIDDRLKARVCELCSRTDVKLEVHHVNKVKNLKGKEPWEQVMIAKRRKTLAVCHDCHQKIHHGF